LGSDLNAHLTAISTVLPAKNAAAVGDTAA
jgi:hypothetical protein